MNTPYFAKDSDYFYFEHGPLLPVPVAYDRPQSVGRTEDGKIKVYDHSLAGTHKRTWTLKALVRDDADQDFAFSDLLDFITSTIVYTKYQFSYYDENGDSYTVRLLSWAEKILKSGLHEVVLILEEDYA